MAPRAIHLDIDKIFLLVSVLTKIIFRDAIFKYSRNAIRYCDHQKISPLEKMPDLQRLCEIDVP